MNPSHIEQRPLSRLTAKFRAERHDRPRYVLGPPTHVGDFSARKTPDSSKHLRPQNRGLPFCLTSHGFRSNEFPQRSHVKDNGDTHEGLARPRTRSGVNAFVGRSPPRKVFPIKEGPRITRFAMCHLPPQEYEQNRFGFPLSRLVNFLPQISQFFVMVFMLAFYRLARGLSTPFPYSGSTGKAYACRRIEDAMTGGPLLASAKDKA